MASAKGARNASVWGTEQLQQGEGRVLSELDKGYDASQGFLGQAAGLYGGMAAQGQPGLDKYRALTLGSGADIQSALEGLGSFQFNRDQGLQAINRRRAAAGMVNSGNADTDAMTFASGLASNTLNQERQALSPFLQMYQQGTAGQAGTLGSQAALATDYFGNRGSVMDATTKGSVELGTQAFKAGDAAKSANQAMLMGGIQAGVGLLGSAFGMPGMGGGGAGGAFSSIFGAKK